MLSKFDTRPNSIWRSRFRNQNDRRMYSKLTYSRVILTDRSKQQQARNCVGIPNIRFICQDFASNTTVSPVEQREALRGGEVNISKHLGLAIDSAILLFYVHAAVTSTHYLLMDRHSASPQLGNWARSLSCLPTPGCRKSDNFKAF